MREPRLVRLLSCVIWSLTCRGQFTKQRIEESSLNGIFLADTDGELKVMIVCLLNGVEFGIFCFGWKVCLVQKMPNRDLVV